MQIKNNYNQAWNIIRSGKRLDEGAGVFNGDEGIVIAIENGKITVAFDDDKYVDYDPTQLDELELSYAVTVHKSQGSEYKAVVIPIFPGPPLLYTRNLLYTAVTRAKELCVIVGRKETLRAMIQNKRENERYTGLSKRLVEMKDLYI